MLSKNKKGNIYIQFSLFFMVFFLLGTITIFLGYFIFALGNDYVVVPLWEQANTSQSTFNHSVAIQQGFNDQVTFYQSINLRLIDNIFFVSWVMFVVGSLIFAYLSREIDNFNWLLTLFYGIMIMLFVLGLFIITIEWFYDDIILNLFGSPIINTPYYTWLKENLGLIFVIHSAILLLVNRLDFDNALSNQRKRKEQEAFEEIL